MRTLTKAPVVDLHPGDFMDVTGMDQSMQFGSGEDVDMQVDETFGVVRPCLLDSDSYETGSGMLIDFNGLSLETGNNHGQATIAYGKSGLCTTASAFMRDLANIFGPITIDSEGTLLFSNPTTSDQLRITALEDAEVELFQCPLQVKASKPYISFNCDHLSDRFRKFKRKNQFVVKGNNPTGCKGTMRCEACRRLHSKVEIYPFLTYF